MDDPVIKCVSYVVKKTFITLGVFVKFLCLRLLDLIGLVFNVIAFCTIVRIPGLIHDLCEKDVRPKFKWRWKYVGILQFLIFIMDIPIYATIPFYLLCPWRIYLVYKGAMKNRDLRHEDFGFEGWEIRARIYKHFIFLLFDIFSIPFSLCLILSWRSVRFVNLLRACKSEKDVKLVIVTQFLLLLLDIIFIPGTVLILLSWRCPILLSKYYRIYFATRVQVEWVAVPDNTATASVVAPEPDSNIVLVQGTVEATEHDDNILDVSETAIAETTDEGEIVVNESENQIDIIPERKQIEKIVQVVDDDRKDWDMKWLQLCQTTNLLLDIISFPVFILTVFSWRIIFMVMRFRLKVASDKSVPSLNKLYRKLRARFWYEAFLLALDIPCLISLALSLITPWRTVQYLSGIRSRFKYNAWKKLEHTIYQRMNRFDEAMKQERLIALVLFPIALADLLSLVALLFCTCTIWRLPFCVNEIRCYCTGKRKPVESRLGIYCILDNVYKFETSLLFWSTCFSNFILFFTDMFCGLLALILVVTIWRAVPLIGAIKRVFTTKIKVGEKEEDAKIKEEEKVEDVKMKEEEKEEEEKEVEKEEEEAEKEKEEDVTCFTVNGGKIRRSIAKHFLFLLVDIPALALCFIHLLFVVKIPAIVSVILGGNFYMEFAMTVYLETARLLVDLAFLLLFLVLCIARPVAVWVHVLEDEEHKKQRLSEVWLVHIRWLVAQRNSYMDQAQSMLSIRIKESQAKMVRSEEGVDGPGNSLMPVTIESEQTFTAVMLSKVICKYTSKLEKLRNTLVNEELDEELIYNTSKLIFFENKMAHLLSRRFAVELMYLSNASVVAYRRNLQVIEREELLYEDLRSDVLSSLKNLKLKQPPLYENKTGFQSRTRKENQQAVLTAVTNGNFVTLILAFINTLLLYRAPSMFKSIFRAPHLRRNIAMKTLKNYGLDFLMLLQILLISLSIYKVPELISVLVINLGQKRSVSAARKAVRQLPLDVVRDLGNIARLVCSWSTIVYTFSSLIFFLLMPLSVMIKIYSSLDKCCAYLISGLLYLVAMALPFIIPTILPSKLGLSLNLSYACAGYMCFLIVLALLFIFVKAKSSTMKVKNIDYVRVNWFNIHVYFNLFLKFLQMMALVFSVRMVSLNSHEHLTTISNYILLVTYPLEVKFILACVVFVLWFFTTSIPIVLEGILKYVEKDTFSKGHFTWRAFLSFFGSTLFMFIPEVGLSYLSCDYSSCGSGASDCARLLDDPEVVCWSTEHKPYAMVSLFGIMWYAFTSILLCLTYNDADNKKQDLQYSPPFSAMENVVKLGIVTAMTLFRDNIYSLVVMSVLLVLQILLTCLWKTVTGDNFANSVRLVVWKLGVLVTVLSCSGIVLLCEFGKIEEAVVFYIMLGVAVLIFLLCSILTYFDFGMVMSGEERARIEFRKVVFTLLARLESIQGLVPSWSNSRFAYKRMLRHVRVAHPKDKTFEFVEPSGAAGDVEKDGVSNLVIPDLDPPPPPPSYEDVLKEKQAVVEADDYFVPDVNLYLSPFGEWEQYDSSKMLDNHGWMITSLKEDFELTDTQCTGCDLLLYLESHIRYSCHSYTFLQDLCSWRSSVKVSTWRALLNQAEELARSVDSGYGLPPHPQLVYTEGDLVPVNPDQSTFPMFIEVADVSSIKLKIHTREHEKLLSLVPQPWKGVIGKLLDGNQPLIRRLLPTNHSQSSALKVTIELFKPLKIRIVDTDKDGFKIAKGALITIPKTLTITHLTPTSLVFAKPYPTGSKGPITKPIETLGAKEISGEWYVVIGAKKARFAKVLATLHKLRYD